MKRIGIFLLTDSKSGGEHQYIKSILDYFDTTPQGMYELLCFCGNSEWERWCRQNNREYIRCRNETNPTENTKRYWWICRKLPDFLVNIVNWVKEAFDYNVRLLKQERVDLYIVPTAHFVSFCHIPSIRMEHDLMHRYERRFQEAGEDFDRREALYISMRRFTNTVVVDSKLGKKQFIESYGKYGRNKVNISPLPYIAPRREYDDKIIELPLDFPTKYLFYPAQFWTHKNHLNLLKAVKKLKDQNINIHLVLVGSEKNGSKSVKDYIQQNGLSANVTILGFVNDDTIVWLYKHAQGMVMPTFFGPTNIPPLEAMNYGCPVAVSNNYAMPEQVGNAGLLFDPERVDEIAKAVRILWTDEEKCKPVFRRSTMNTPTFLSITICC